MGNVQKPYEVVAGRYNECFGPDYRYIEAFATLDEALEAFDMCEGYVWRALSYKGRVLLGQEP